METPLIVSGDFNSDSHLVGKMIQKKKKKHEWTQRVCYRMAHQQVDGKSHFIDSYRVRFILT